ncbi:MAG: isopentenyl-diphosphate Delta-isomerase [Chitinophagaceae bacterium]
MNDEQQVVLVNEQDEVVGIMEKIEAHRKAFLHRAFSVFIFNRKGEMLLQQRALQKYHSGGLWTNACCSHPLPDEAPIEAALRRLQEEMGFGAELHKIFDFIYRHEFDNGLTEYEFDHVFAGRYDGPVSPDNEEVKDYCYKPLNDIEESLLSHPQKYTAWFHLAFPKVVAWAKENTSNVASIAPDTM